MKIAYNPTTEAALTAAPSNNDITFDLKGVAVYAKGVKFKGTDTTYSVFKKHTASGNTGGYNGLVPVPSYTTTTVRFLREDGTWATPTNATYSVVSSTANGLAPAIGTTCSTTIATQADEWVLTSTKGGTPTWRKLPVNAFKNDNTNTTYTLSGGLSGNNYTVTLTPSSGSATTATIPVMTAATSSAAGKAGLVPAPAANQHTLFLKGDGTWATPANTHYTTHLYIGAKDAASNAATTNGNTYIKVADNTTIRNQYIIKGSGITAVASDANGNVTINTPANHNQPTSDINKLTGYAIATSAAALATTDTLNVALGKLEYKLNIAYDLVTKANDGDGTIENLKEILDVLAGIKDTETIKAIIGKYLPLAGGTMTLGEGLKFHADENYFGTNLDARIISLLDGNGTTCDGGLIIDERCTSNGTTTVTELLRIRDAEFKWKGNNILHSGNSSVTKSGQTLTVTINGTSQSLTNSTYNFSGASFTSGNQNTAEHDANKITSNGVWYYNANGPATSLGASTTDGALYSQAYSTSWVGQIAQDYRDGDLFTRGRNNGTWTTWKRVAYANDIPTSLKNPNALTLQAGTFAAKTYDGSVAVTVNIPTKTSHLTNDSGYLTSRGYIGTTAVQASSATQNLTGIGSASFSGVVTINTSIKDHAKPTDQCLVINSTAVPEGTTLTLKNSPGIGFHIANKSWGSLVFNSTFNFINNDATSFMPVKASKFITNGGTSSQFVKGDGSLDSNTYLTSHQSLANYVTLNTAQTISGVKTFSTQQKFTVAQGTSPFTVTSTTKVTNLNADLLDGYDSSAFVRISKIANSTNLNTLTSNLLYYTDTDGNTTTLTNAPYTNSFMMLQLQGYSSGDDVRRYRLAINGYGDARLFNDRDTANTGGTWVDILTSKNYTAYLGYIGTTAVQKSSAAQALTGITNATMSGLTTTNTLKITSTSAVAHITFSRGNYNYISAPTGGSIGFCVNGNAAGTGANCEMVISDGTIFPGTTNVTTLGDTSHYWTGVYAHGFYKNGSSNSYVLLGGGGHKALSDFMLKSEILTNNLTTISKSLTVTQAWMDTGIKYTDLPATGTYIVQLTVSGTNNSTGNMYSCYWSGIMSWYRDGTNDSETDEIILHRSGHAYGNTIYLRTIMTASSDGRHLRLQIAANKDLGAAYTYTFKFKRII